VTKWPIHFGVEKALLKSFFPPQYKILAQDVSSKVGDKPLQFLHLIFLAFFNLTVKIGKIYSAKKRAN